MRALLFTEGHRTFTAAALHLAHEEDPDADQQQHWEPRNEMVVRIPALPVVHRPQ